MGVDTKGAIGTPCKDFFLVTEIVEKSLNRLIRQERELAFPDLKGYQRVSPAVRKHFEECSTAVVTDHEMAKVHFRFRGVSRGLLVFFGCDCDHLELAPKSLSFSLGASGESVLFMMSVLWPLSMLGPIAFTEADSRDELTPWTEAPPTMLEVARLRLVSLSSVRRWVDYADQVFGHDAAAWVAFIGCPRDDLALALEGTYEQLETFINTQPLPRQPRFLEDYHARALPYEIPLDEAEPA